MATYLALFCASFLAATIIPMQSEAALVALLATDLYSVWLLVVVACFGNVLGAVVNWMLGRRLESYKDRQWFPVKEDALKRARALYDRYGRWCLFFSWLPIIGD